MVQKETNNALFEAVKTGDIEQLKSIIQNGAKVSVKDDQSYTPLHVCNDVEVAKVLIDAGAKVNAKDDCERTPLHVCNDVEVAKVLINAGADVNAKDDDGNTPLDYYHTESCNQVIEAAGGIHGDIEHHEGSELYINFEIKLDPDEDDEDDYCTDVDYVRLDGDKCGLCISGASSDFGVPEGSYYYQTGDAYCYGSVLVDDDFEELDDEVDLSEEILERLADRSTRIEYLCCSGFPDDVRVKKLEVTVWANKKKLKFYEKKFNACVDAD